MSKHTPGPLYFLEASEVDQPHYICAPDGPTAKVLRIEDAARIVACVNALEGIDDPAEFIRFVKELIAEIRALEVK